MATNIFGCRKKNALSTLLSKLLIYGSCFFVKLSTNIVLLASVGFGCVVFKKEPKQK